MKEVCISHTHTETHTHTHPFNGPFLGLPGWAGTRKVKPIWILLKQETVSGSGISWAICKSASRSRQITMPVPHHSFFYRPDALPAAQPTASKHWRQICISHSSTKWVPGSTETFSGVWTNHNYEKITVTFSPRLCVQNIINDIYKYKLPSVHWRCWLGGRKGIRPVKNWVVGRWRGYLSGVRRRLAYGPADATATHCLLLR